MWRKSSYSTGSGNCVEVAHAAGSVLVRDTKQAGRGDRATLSIPAREWARFTATLRVACPDM